MPSSHPPASCRITAPLGILFVAKGIVTLLIACSDMRSIPGFVFAAVFALAVSCTSDSNFAPIHFSDDEPRGGRASGYEPADLLVGEYHYVLDYVATSRYESGSFHDEGSLWIEKTGENTVMMAGAWEAYGSVYGNTVQFDNAIETFLSPRLPTATVPLSLIIRLPARCDISGSTILGRKKAPSWPRNFRRSWLR